MDWIQITAITLGVSLGAYIGYRVNCWRVRTGAPGASGFEKAAQDPALSALVLALSAFAGCAVAYDVSSLFRDPAPESFVAKYIFALVLGGGHYVFLKGLARPKKSESEGVLR
jgi:hypothetical protein